MKGESKRTESFNGNNRKDNVRDDKNMYLFRYADDRLLVMLQEYKLLMNQVLFIIGLLFIKYV